MQTLTDLADRFEHASVGYAAQHGIRRDDDWLVLKMHEELGELTQTWISMTGRGKRRGQSDEALAQALADETADLFGLMLMFVRQHRIDLPAAVRRKWKFDPEV